MTLEKSILLSAFRLLAIAKTLDGRLLPALDMVEEIAYVLLTVSIVT